MSEIGSQEECDKFPGRLRDLCEGRGRDGRKHPRLADANAFRQKNGLPPLQMKMTVKFGEQAGPVEKEWDVSQPSRGLGDVVKKITHATGIDKVVEAVVGKKGCGCNKRQESLNQMVPFQ